jgi:hypothetical protein
MHVRLLFWIGLVGLACTPAAPPSAPAKAAMSAIEPMTLRYHGEHRGDHPSWIYTAHVSVTAESYAGRPAWRRSYRFETVASQASEVNITIEGTIVLERDSLAPLEAQSTFGKTRRRAIFRSDRVEVTGFAEDATPSRTTVPVHGMVVTDVWAGLDLYLLALPLRVGLEKRVDILVDDDKPPRPFSLSVERIERVRVPAGELEAFRIRVDPLDGDDRMRSIYHVRTTDPGVVVRKEYVVNPRTEGAMKQSTGIEELEAVVATAAAVPTAKPGR